MDGELALRVDDPSDDENYTMPLSELFPRGAGPGGSAAMPTLPPPDHTRAYLGDPSMSTDTEQRAACSDLNPTGDRFQRCVTGGCAHEVCMDCMELE